MADRSDMKYWFDCEFIEDGRTIDLISIGIVAEDGREFYAVSNEFDPSKANEWVEAHVLPLLPPTDDPAWMSRAEIKSGILEFVQSKPTFWGYYADYDWVCLCQLFGRMIDLPDGYPMYCRDLKQLADSMGVSRLPDPPKAEHNALEDARWNKRVHDYLFDMMQWKD